MSGLAIIESGVVVDLLFSDVVMPGPLRSPELARKSQERQPGLAVLFTSGYTENAIVHGGRIDEGVELLSKPYTRDALARKIRHVLNTHRQRASTQSGDPRYAKPGVEVQDESSQARPLRILLVEDEALIRLATADMLSIMRHEVTEAGSGEAAIAALKQDKFDVLITDLSLPGMHGAAVAAEAKKLQPNLRIIFASGAASSGFDDVTNSIVLRKPYTEEDIVLALKRARATL